MTFEEMEERLPSGLHDASLQALRVDWVKREVEIDLGVQTRDDGECRRLGRVVVGDLLFCAIEPPEDDAGRGYEPLPARGLTIGTGAGTAEATSKKALPRVPDGYFLQWIFVREWNAFIHICGRDVSLHWLEDEPR
jgi:hypothetical protein